MSRPIDRSKKSNIKCEHCANWHDNKHYFICLITGEIKEYWRAGCEKFTWDETKKYKAGEGK